MEWMDEHDDDAQVVARVRAGDTAAFRTIVDRHGRSLFRLAFRMIGNEQDAEDVVQETFLKAYRQMDRFESRASLKTWLYRIAVNCSLDLMRQRPRQAEVADQVDPQTGLTAAERAVGEGPGVDALVYGSEVQRRVAEALEQLSHAERAAFILRHFEGRTIEEIGTVLGLRTSATKHSVFRAVQKMRRALEPVVRSMA